MRLSPFLRDVILTTVTSIVTMVCSVLVTRFLAMGLGPVEFGAYTLARRIVSTAIPFATLCMGVALPRYLGFLSSQGAAPPGYLTGAGAITTFFTALVIAVLLGNRRMFAIWLFKDARYQPLIGAIAFMIIGIAFYQLVYANYRGHLQMVKANLWEIAITALGPLVLAYLLTEGATAGRMVFSLGSLSYLVLVPLIWKLWDDVRQLLASGSLGNVLKQLCCYGGPRVPGGFAFAGLLTLGPALAPHFGGLEEAGYLTVGQSILRIMDSAVVAFGLVALPRLARYSGAGKEDALRENMADLVAFLFQIGLFATLHIWLWTDPIVPLWLGTQYSAAIPVARVLVVALIPYLAYVVLRWVVDAVEVQAVNTLNLFIALGTAAVIGVALAASGLGVTGLAWGTTAGFVLLGGLTVSYLWRRFRFSWRRVLWGRTVFTNGILFVLAWAAHQWWIGGERGFIILGKLALIEGALFGIYLALLWWWGVGWMQEVRNRIQIGQDKA